MTSHAHRLTLVGALCIAGGLAHASMQAGPATSPAQEAEAAAPGGPLFAPPPPPAAESVVMLQLRDGTVRFGAIENPGPEGIEFVRLDTSGRARLPWSMLDPVQAEALRTEFGLVDVEAESLFVSGSRLLLEGGGSVEGVILSKEGDMFLIKNGGNVQALPKSRVRAIESNIELPALDVYRPEEMYERLLAVADLETPGGRLDLARKSEAILDFAHAVEHLEAALAMAQEEGASLDQDFELTTVQAMLARAQVKAENQEQLDVLREADTLRKKGRFDEAIALAQAFPQQYPRSPLVEDARKAEKRLMEARDEAAVDLVRRRWAHWARKLTRQRALMASPTFEADRTWAIETLPEEIQRRVHADLVAGVSEAIDFDAVRSIFDARPRKKYSAATYGSAGTWLLGRDAAIAGIEGNQGGGREAEQSVADAERAAINERIRRYVENQRLASRRTSAGEESDRTQEFWANWSPQGRAQWLMAYYAEEAGDFELRERPDLRNCGNCAGEGAIEQFIAGTVLRGESRGLAPCPRCHGVQVVRRIYYR